MNIQLGDFCNTDTPKPTAWIREDGVIAFHSKTEVDSQGFKWFPLYLQPQKYCPSENNDAYEKGFIDGMAKMTESAVHRAVEGMASKAKDRFPNYESICLQCGTTIYKPFKELTDKEIEEIAEEFKDVDYTLDEEEAFDVFNHRGFARAILRKAQEK